MQRNFRRFTGKTSYIFLNNALKLEMRKDIKDSACGFAAFKWVVILPCNFRTLLRKVLCEIRTHVELNFNRAVR